MQKTHLTRISGNVKTGPIPVSTTSASTCPDACPFKSAGCYAEGGPLNIHWKKVTEGDRGSDFGDFCDEVKKFPKGQVWRHNQAGDLQGKNDFIDTSALLQLTKANKGRKGFTYTHKPVLAEDVPGNHLTLKEKEVIAKSNRDAVKLANQSGFTVNLSGNNKSHADKLAALGIAPVVCVVPSDETENSTTQSGRKVVTCPATKAGSYATCATCQLCQKQRGAIVAFPSHGMRKKMVDNSLKGGE